MFLCGDPGTELAGADQRVTRVRHPSLPKRREGEYNPSRTPWPTLSQRKFVLGIGQGTTRVVTTGGKSGGKPRSLVGNVPQVIASNMDGYSGMGAFVFLRQLPGNLRKSNTGPWGTLA